MSHESVPTSLDPAPSLSAGPDAEELDDKYDWDIQHLVDDNALGDTRRRPSQVPQRADEGARFLPVERVRDVDWTRHFPSIAEVHDPVMGRLLAVGDVHAQTFEWPGGEPNIGCEYHLSIMLHARHGWQSWERLDPVAGQIRLQNWSGLRQGVKLVPYAQGYLGRSVIAVEGEVLPTYTSWFATTAAGILILRRESWERLEQGFE